MGLNFCRSDKEKHMWEHICSIFSLIWGSFLSHFHFLQLNQYFLSHKRKQNHNLTSPPTQNILLNCLLLPAIFASCLLSAFWFFGPLQKFKTLASCAWWWSYLSQISQLLADTGGFYQVTVWISYSCLENGKYIFANKQKKNLNRSKTCFFLSNKFPRKLTIFGEKLEF